jgi:hypothetical protein
MLIFSQYYIDTNFGAGSFNQFAIKHILDREIQ